MDFFLQLINAANDLTMNTHIFFLQFLMYILHSPEDPNDSIRRFSIKTITLNKDDSPSMHEYLSLEILDSSDLKTYLFFLERMPSSLLDPLSYFTDHADSYRIRDAIVDGLADMPNDSTEDMPNDSTEDIPLLPRSISSELPPPSPVAPRSFTQMIDSATLASAHSINSSSSILTRRFRATDQFLIGHGSKESHGRGRIIRQLEPQGLSLFDLIILAKVVHDEDPIYSLLHRQCYWFSNVIFQVIKRNFPCKVIESEGSDEIYWSVRIPPNQYLPDEAGRWRGLRISKITETITQIMTEKFNACRVEDLRKVC